MKSLGKIVNSKIGKVLFEEHERIADFFFSLLQTLIEIFYGFSTDSLLTRI